MTQNLLLSLLYALGLLSLFLILGLLLRAKIVWFQKAFVPASVIGGFLLLLLGPQILNLIPIPKDWLSFYGLLPGVLIIPIVTAVPLGLKLEHTNHNTGSLRTLFPLFFIAMGISFLQFFIGFGSHWLFARQYEFYPTFGWELGLGFAGGHGTAGLIGNMLRATNQAYWQLAQGVTVTTATFGLVGGILLGMIAINIGIRKGWTNVLTTPEELPHWMQKGIIAKGDHMPSLGVETTSSTAIDSYAFHGAIILSVSYAAFLILSFVKMYSIPILDKISIWAYGLLLMMCVNAILQKLDMSHLISGKTKGHISSTLTEFAVIAAIASMPLKMLALYWLPILVIITLGFIGTALFLFIMCYKCLDTYWFETAITFFGMYTGVFITGLLLLRICDPTFKSPVLTNYSLAYTFSGIIYFGILNMLLHYILNNTISMTTLLSLIATLSMVCCALLVKTKK